MTHSTEKPVLNGAATTIRPEMSTTPTGPRPSKATRRIPWWRRVLPWACGATLAIGILVAAAVFLGDTAPPKETFSNEPADVTKPEKNIALPAEVKQIARTFIQTAVARRNLEVAYPLVGPAIKQGMTLTAWKTGNIAVIPFPVEKLDFATFKVDYAHARDVLMEVALLSNDASVKGQVFYINVKKFGKGVNAKWLVDSWVPRSSALVPLG